MILIAAADCNYELRFTERMAAEDKDYSYLSHSLANSTIA